MSDRHRKRIADYEFVSEGEEGANGTFFLAPPPARLGLDVELVAVKVISGLTQDDSIRRGARELRAFAAVDSDLLVRLHDAGQDGSALFYSMEYLPLGSLARGARPLRRTEVLTAVRDAALAADALHEAGLAHHDIEPRTVLLHEHGAKLADLGLAQTLSSGHASSTGIPALEGIEYLDPAMLGGASASRSTDIWSLGATLHRALAGVGFYGVLALQRPLLAVRKVLSSTPEISVDLSPAERAVVERAIAADLQARYATAREMADDIDELIELQQVSPG